MAASWACASAPPPDPEPPAPPPPVLAHALPLGGRVTYEFADTVRVETDGERVRFATEAGYRGLARLRYRNEAGELRVNARLLEFEGHVSNPTTGSTRASLADVDGEWDLALSRDGKPETRSVPDLSDEVLAVVGTRDLLRLLFIPLPDAAAEVGSEWVDTVRTSDETPGVSQSTTAVVRTRVAEADDASGRVVLTLESVTETTVRGTTSGGVDEPSTQSLRGTIRRSALWDVGLQRLLHYRASGRLTGTLRVEGLGEIPLTADVVREVRER